MKPGWGRLYYGLGRYISLSPILSSLSLCFLPTVPWTILLCAWIRREKSPQQWDSSRVWGLVLADTANHSGLETRAPVQNEAGRLFWRQVMLRNLDFCLVVLGTQKAGLPEVLGQICALVSSFQWQDRKGLELLGVGQLLHRCCPQACRPQLGAGAMEI